MRIGLCMIVKDEANRIAGALDGVIDLFDQVTVIDTGSTDGTLDILRERYGVEPLISRLDEGDCFCKSRVLNEGYARMRSPWILTLDGDERVSRADLAAAIALPEPADPRLAGYFCAWNTYRGEEVIEDYKLALLRSDIRRHGLIHDNAQYDLRRRDLTAVWLDTLTLVHRPEAAKDEAKAVFYRWRLDCALGRDPDWARYHWFRGYMRHRAGDLAGAEASLMEAVASTSPWFPVERLNAAIVLAEIYARQGRRDEVVTLLENAGRLFDSVADDFEVRINVRLGPWLTRSLAAARVGDLAAVAAYGFSC